VSNIPKQIAAIKKMVIYFFLIISPPKKARNYQFAFVLLQSAGFLYRIVNDRDCITVKISPALFGLPASGDCSPGFFRNSICGLPCGQSGALLYLVLRISRTSLRIAVLILNVILGSIYCLLPFPFSSHKELVSRGEDLLSV
jgi:hypothetical protein